MEDLDDSLSFLMGVVRRDSGWEGKTRTVAVRPRDITGKSSLRLHPQSNSQKES